MQGSEKKYSPWRERTGKRLGSVLIVALVWLGVCTGGRSEELFLLRARVLKVQQKTPPAGQEFHVSYGGSTAVAAGDRWTAWTPCTKKMWDALRRDYPNNGRTNPMVFWLNFKEALDTTHVEVEVKLPADPKSVYRMPGYFFFDWLIDVFHDAVE